MKVFCDPHKIMSYCLQYVLMKVFSDYHNIMTHGLKYSWKYLQAISQNNDSTCYNSHGSILWLPQNNDLLLTVLMTVFCDYQKIMTYCTQEGTVLDLIPWGRGRIPWTFKHMFCITHTFLCCLVHSAVLCAVVKLLQASIFCRCEDKSSICKSLVFLYSTKF